MKYIILLLLFGAACTSRSDKKTNAVNDLLELYEKCNRFERVEYGNKVVIKDVFSITDQKNFKWKRIKWKENENKQPTKIDLEIFETEFHNLMTLGSNIEQDKDGGWIYFYSKEYQNILPVVNIELELVNPGMFDKTNFDNFMDSFLDTKEEIIIPQNGYMSNDLLRFAFRIPNFYKVTRNVIVFSEINSRIGVLNNNSDNPEKVTNELFDLFKTLITMNNTDNVVQQ